MNGFKSDLLLQITGELFNSYRDNTGWTALVYKMSVLLTGRIIVYLLTISVTLAQTTGKYCSHLHKPPDNYTELEWTYWSYIVASPHL